MIVELSRKYKKKVKNWLPILWMSLSSIYDWDKQFDELKAFRNQNTKRLSGGGEKSIISNYEKEILYYSL